MITISLDNHATTPVDPLVVSAMEPYWISKPWNAHSAHYGGEVAANAVKHARAEVAHLLGASPNEVVFTSGATEANNLAILGIALAALEQGSHRRRIVTSSIEHKCVLAAAAGCERFGFRHDIVPVRSDGVVDLEVLKAKLSDDVLLVSIMAANNEIGVIQPIEAVAAMCTRVGVIFHTDAAQAVGKIPFDVLENGCDLASISSHKFYGPAGIGALFVSAGSPMRPKALLVGGGQEGGLRSGTLPVPLIVGFGKAAALAEENISVEAVRMSALAGIFLEKLRAEGVECTINGARSPRVPGSLNLRVPGLKADEMISRLGARLLLSTGSACNSGELQGSYVLSGLGLPDADVSASFRLCFGRFNTPMEAVEAAVILAEAIRACQNATGEIFQ